MINFHLPSDELVAEMQLSDRSVKKKKIRNLLINA